MIKAVIATGGKQYIVSEGETINVELLTPENGSDAKQVKFEPLLVIDDEKVSIGSPVLTDITVTAEILDEVRNDKVTSIRYKAKKRVHKLRGHKQRMTPVRITKIV